MTTDNANFVTVVIPSRDRPRLLNECLEHLARDGLASRLQVIVADDSSDGSLEISVPPELHSVRIVRSGGRGNAAARNAGWQAATAETILFLDDDIRPRPGAIQRLAGALRAGKADWVSAHVILGCERTPAVSVLTPGFGQGMVQNEEHYALSAGCLMTRRECLEEIVGFCEEHERFVDLELSIRAASRGHRLWFIANAVAVDLDPKVTGTTIANRIMTSYQCMPRILVKHLTRIDRARANHLLQMLRCAHPFCWQNGSRSALRQLLKCLLSLPGVYAILHITALAAEWCGTRWYARLGRVFFAVSLYKGFGRGLAELSREQQQTLRKWLCDEYHMLPRPRQPAGRGELLLPREPELRKSNIVPRP